MVSYKYKNIHLLLPDRTVIKEMRDMMKCLTCPYRLGLIKCVTDPCPQCRTSKSRKHPFPEPEIKYDRPSKPPKD